MKNIIYISDFFVNEIIGGAELSDDVVIQFLTNKGYNIKTIKSQTFNPTIHKADTFIISNFVGLSSKNKNWLVSSGTKYIIIERDQKYVKSRNTAEYPGFIAPQSEVVNKTFYRAAKKVFCLTSKQAEIMNTHLEIENIKSLGCTQFSNEQLNILESNINSKSNGKYAIIQGKRQDKAIALCQRENFEYDILNPMSYDNLINKLSEYTGIIFFSHAFESCCRLLIEAKVLGLKIITDNRNGCTYEDWFKKYKKEELLSFLRSKVIETIKTIENEL